MKMLSMPIQGYLAKEKTHNYRKMMADGNILAGGTSIVTHDGAQQYIMMQYSLIAFK
jgi:hypothetical protein